MLRDQFPQDKLLLYQDWLDKEWGRCSDLRGAFESHAVTYLLTVNGGGAATVIAFSGSASYATNGVYWSISIFLFGLICTGATIVLALYRMSWITRELGLDHRKFNNSELRSSDLERNHEERFNQRKFADYTGWLAFICFIVGIVVSVFTYQGYLTSKSELKKPGEAASCLQKDTSKVSMSKS